MWSGEKAKGSKKFDIDLGNLYKMKLDLTDSTLTNHRI